MLKYLTRGGQIQMHQIRMIRQILKFGCYFGLLFFIILSSFRVYKLSNFYDFKAIGYYTLLKAEYDFNPLKSFMMEDLSSKSYLREIRHIPFKSGNNISGTLEQISSDKYMHQYCIAFLLDLKDVATQSSYISLIFVSSLFIFWLWYGRFKSQDKQTKGGTVFTAVEASKYLRLNSKASDFKIAGMPLVKNSETTHILITGTTGSGKSNCMHEILPQIREKNQTAILIDFTGEMISRYYDAGRGDIILCPFDARSHEWDFWSEIGQIGEGRGDYNIDLDLIAKALFVNDDSSSDPFWREAAEVLFKDCVRYVAKNKESSLEKLDNIMNKTDVSKLGKKLTGTSSAAFISKENDKTFASIRTHVATATATLNYLPETKPGSDKSMILRDFIKEVDHNPGKWLFISATAKTRGMMRPLASLWANILSNNIMSLTPSVDRRIWLVIDELPSLKKLPSLSTALSEFRKYGGAIIAGLQSSQQLYQIYGSYNASAMLDQFNTKIVFRTDEKSFASYICNSFGEIEYTKSQESLSYGAHEMRDGVSFGSSDKKDLLVTPFDLGSLKDMEALVKLPDYHCKAVKIQMSYQPSRKNLAEGFIERIAKSNNVFKLNYYINTHGFWEYKKKVAKIFWKWVD